ncbi:MAG: hypothetical protein QM692_13595 [Thermomicrobiales bacterium]
MAARRATAHYSGISGISRRGVTLALTMAALAPRRASATSVARQAGATGKLLVRGTADLPGGVMAWRVVQDMADTMGVLSEQRALGFAVNSSPFTDLLFTDDLTGSAALLAPGEASFVREGVMQRRESLGDGPEAYLRIGLVDAGAATYTGGDRLIFAGPPFTVEPGVRTLALRRWSLALDDVIEPGVGVGEALVLVEQGEIDLSAGIDPVERLRATVGSDTVYAVRSAPPPLHLVAQRDATSVLIATIS